MATSLKQAITTANQHLNNKAEQQFQQYLQCRFGQFVSIAALAIVPFLLFVGIANASMFQAEPRSATLPGDDRPTKDLPLPQFKPSFNPADANPSVTVINTFLATLLGGGGLVALWRVKNETDAKAHEFSIKLLTMQKELLESNRTEVVQYFENRTAGITEELRLIRDRLVVLEHEVSQLLK
ncbi:hypothetical protein Pse7367_3795 (plasmid) [Thalassoporum mexicanum PCC 7367]|uniref:hypothetical protein n=1 Tax=Thalassoporum mexicanum TaxID=3457544 RepID=UPI00029FB730|nr:hypothetical protein [Pseudanabaena sp. PCC 7367]AFY72018.1 hypothetical protein Pse7367_3795 [Pseudanabaena sp. PCC 7367]